MLQQREKHPDEWMSAAGDDRQDGSDPGIRSITAGKLHHANGGSTGIDNR